ncbi:hypothetical protein ACWCXB_24085 [Streptomyces sp. NPDC001514]
MQVAIEKAGGLLDLFANGKGQYCLWPYAVPPPDGWFPALRTTERGRFINALQAELPGLMAVTLDKQPMVAAARR